MAEIIIKMFDTETGGVDLSVDFNPEYDATKVTLAQNFAGAVLQFIEIEAENIKEFFEEQANAETQGEDTNPEANETTQEQEEVQKED